MSSTTHRKMQESIQTLEQTISAMRRRAERVADQWAGDSAIAKLPNRLMVNARFSNVPDEKIEEYTGSMRHFIKDIHADLKAIEELTNTLARSVGALDHCNETLRHLTEKGGRG